MNSVAAQYQWPLFTAGVSKAFLRGLTFEQAAQMTYEVQRDVWFTLPPGSTQLFNKLLGLTGFNPFTEVLRMLRCGIWLNDAPRLWSKVPRRVLQALGLLPTKADPQLFARHVPWNSGSESSRTGSRNETRSATSATWKSADDNRGGESSRTSSQNASKRLGRGSQYARRRLQGRWRRCRREVAPCGP